MIVEGTDADGAVVADARIIRLHRSAEGIFDSFSLATAGDLAPD